MAYQEQNIEMVCECGASLLLNISASVDDVWLLANRFANAHVPCGYMTNPDAPAGEMIEGTTVIHPKQRVVEDDLDEDEE